MNALQIFEEILSRTDAELLASFANEERLTCSVCGALGVRPLADFATTGMGSCQTCRTRHPLVKKPYYVKQKSTNPAQAVLNHRYFWTQVYYQQVVEQKLRINPHHPVPDPLSAYRTQAELEIFRATHLMQLAGLQGLLSDLRPQEQEQRQALEIQLARVQGILDADGWWRAQVELEGGKLPHTRMADPQGATHWAYEILVKYQLMTPQGQKPTTSQAIGA